MPCPGLCVCVGGGHLEGLGVNKAEALLLSAQSCRKDKIIPRLFPKQLHNYNYKCLEGHLFEYSLCARHLAHMTSNSLGNREYDPHFTDQETETLNHLLWHLQSGSGQLGFASDCLMS